MSESCYGILFIISGASCDLFVLSVDEIDETSKCVYVWATFGLSAAEGPFIFIPPNNDDPFSPSE